MKQVKNNIPSTLTVTQLNDLLFNGRKIRKNGNILRQGVPGDNRVRGKREFIVIGWGIYLADRKKDASVWPFQWAAEDNTGTIQFDARTNTVMAEVPQDNIREKVKAVREVVPGKSNNEIVLVLQYYDYVVEKTIQAYLEDGAKRALTEWNFSRTKPSKKKKNKKNKNNSAQSTKPESEDVNGNLLTNHIDHVPNLLNLDIPMLNGDINGELHLEENMESSTEKIDIETSSLPVLDNRVPVVTAEDFEVDITPAVEHPLPPAVKHPATHLVDHSTVSAVDHHKKSSHKPHQVQHTRHRTESSSKPTKPHTSLEKSTKDLQRQTISLERYRLVLNEEIDKAYKRIQTVFEEVRNELNTREVKLITEMDKLKKLAHETISMRQKTANDLRVQVDRASRMNESQLAELRLDIKHFVSERKIDEDLGTTNRFVADTNHFFAEIHKFGELVPLKCSYSVRRPSLSSLESSELDPDSLSRQLSTTESISSMSTGAVNEKSKTDSTSMQEMAELQQKLKNSLRLQGLPVRSPPKRGNRPQTAPQFQSREFSSNTRERVELIGKSVNALRSQSFRGSRGWGRGRGRGRGRGGPYQGNRDVYNSNQRSRSPKKNEFLANPSSSQKPHGAATDTAVNGS